MSKKYPHIYPHRFFAIIRDVALLYACEYFALARMLLTGEFCRLVGVKNSVRISAHRDHPFRYIVTDHFANA